MEIDLTNAECVEVLYALSVWKTDVGRRVDVAMTQGHTDVFERAEAIITRIDALALKFGGVPPGA